MSVIRVVWGNGTGPTAMSSYDAALADANVHNYNLVTVSSVLPAGAALEAVGTAPALGPPGNRLTVVQARETVDPGGTEPAVAGLGWARDESERGVFYEESGTDPDRVRETIEAGLERARELREWTFTNEDAVVRRAGADADAYTTQVVCALYGESVPVL